jgi:hypothetical protein
MDDIAIPIVTLFYVALYICMPGKPMPHWFVRHVLSNRLMTCLFLATVPISWSFVGPRASMSIATLVVLTIADYRLFSAPAAVEE